MAVEPKPDDGAVAAVEEAATTVTDLTSRRFLPGYM
jgi:hypothetical protein